MRVGSRQKTKACYKKNPAYEVYQYRVNLSFLCALTCISMYTCFQIRGFAWPVVVPVLFLLLKVVVYTQLSINFNVTFSLLGAKYVFFSAVW
jgi:hypothetical protein